MSFPIAQMISRITPETLLSATAQLALGLFVRALLMRAAAKVIKKANVKESLHHIILTVISLILYFLIFISVADALGVQTTSVVALFGIAGFAISLSLQGVLSNFTSCAVLLAVQPFSAGDYVEADGIEGIVKYVGLVYTTLVTYDNKTIYVPNSHLMTAKIVNHSGDGRRRVDLTFKVGYDASAEAVKTALREAVERFPKVYENPAPYIHVTEYGDFCVSYALRVWCDTADYWTLHDALLEAVAETFAAHNIAHAYPQSSVSVVERH